MKWPTEKQVGHVTDDVTTW